MRNPSKLLRCDQISVHHDNDTNISELKGEMDSLLSGPTKRLLCVNAIVAGLEIASCVAFSVIPPLLLKSGFSETQMTTLFGVGPLLALLTVSEIGRLSDSCSSPYGRRRPFIAASSFLLITSLIVIALGQLLVTDSSTKFTGVIVLTVSVVILDFSYHIAINPCESLNADVVSGIATTNKGSENGFMIYSGMSSLGCCIGYLLSSVDWQDALASSFSGERTAILLVVVLVSVTLFITLYFAKEKPSVKKRQHVEDMGYCSENESSLLSSVEHKKIEKAKLKVSRFRIFSWKYLNHIWLFPYRVLFCAPSLKGICAPVMQLVSSITTAPEVLRRLFWADLFSWMGIMSHTMFCTDFVAQVVYSGHPTSTSASGGAGEQFPPLTNLEDEENFDAGVRMGSFGLLLHSLTACIFAVCGMEHLSCQVGLKRTYIYGLLIFGFSMLLTVLFPNVVVLNICAGVSGIGYAIINSVPNSLITAYHAQPSLYFFSKGGDDGEVRGFGGDMAILDSSYLLSQIILSMFLGIVVDATGMPHFYILVASLSSFMAAYLGSKVTFPN